MNQDLVIVESKTINNESVPIVINVAETRNGEVVDRREISRSVIFQDFQAKIPLKWARILIKKNPEEFRIVDAISDEPNNLVKAAVKVAKEEAKGFVCEQCGIKAKSKAGLVGHIRLKHKKKEVTNNPVSQVVQDSIEVDKEQNSQDSQDAEVDSKDEAEVNQPTEQSVENKEN